MVCGWAVAFASSALGCLGTVGRAGSDTSTKGRDSGPESVTDRVTDGGDPESGIDGAPAVDAAVPASCNILASNYDQTCYLDQDCVGVAGNFVVQFGNYCEPQCLCGSGAINNDAVVKFYADVLKTPLGSGALQQGECGCPEYIGPCCRNETCVVGPACVPQAPDAGAHH
jgi:hypothetical protein